MRRRIGRANALQRQRVELHAKQERVILKLSAAMVNNAEPEYVAKVQRQLHAINRALEALAKRLLVAEELAGVFPAEEEDGDAEKAGERAGGDPMGWPGAGVRLPTVHM
jgi:hypothetical protein